MWSQVSIEGRPRLLIANACAEVGGDEAEFCRRLFGALRRRGLDVVGQGPLDVADAGAVLASADRPNCLFLLAEDGRAEESWAYLGQRVQKPLFLSVCSLGGADPQVAEDVLAGGGVAPSCCCSGGANDRKGGWIVLPEALHRAMPTFRGQHHGQNAMVLGGQGQRAFEAPQGGGEGGGAVLTIAGAGN